MVWPCFIYLMWNIEWLRGSWSTSIRALMVFVRISPTQKYIVVHSICPLHALLQLIFSLPIHIYIESNADTSVAVVGNGNIRRSRHSAIISHWRAIQSRSNWWASDHKHRRPLAHPPTIITISSNTTHANIRFGWQHRVNARSILAL